MQRNRSTRVGATSKTARFRKRPLQRRRTLKRTLQLVEIAFCFVHYLVQRNVLFFREFLAVFKFGGGVTNVAVHSRNLYPYVAELRVDAYGFARERAALCAIGSCAERGDR